MRQDKAKTFLKVARALAEEFSKDSSTKVGCFFLDPEDSTELTRGYNGMPRGIDETRPERFERPLKYDYFEHAERNAIFNLARRYLRGSMVIMTTAPTVGCIRALLSVGSTMAVVPASAVQAAHWPVALSLLSEGGVQVLVAEEGQVRPLAAHGDTPLPSERLVRKVLQNLAYAVRREAILCKDPQGGAAVFISPEDFTILAEGYSGLPRRANDEDVARYAGAQRALWVEPAVRNAVYNVVRPLLKGSTCVVTATTCVECARAVSAVGAERLVYQEPNPEFRARWGESIRAALDILQELKLSVTSVSEAELR